MNGTIYIIKNHINNKVCIGQTIQPVETRFNQHLRFSKYNSNQCICKAIKKHGKENFYFEVLITGIDNLNKLNELEEHYIEKYNSLSPKGYNLCPGGQKWRKAPKLSDTQEKEIVLKYTEGFSSQQLAEMYNVSKRCVLNILHKENCELRNKNCNLPNRTSIVTKEVMEELYVNSNMMIKDIAEKLGVSVKAINRAKRRYNLKRI